MFFADFANNAFNNINPLLKSVTKSSSTSALSAERQATAEANAFNASQAALNRDFQQASADKANAFNALEAEKSRQFAAEQAEISRAFEKEQADSAFSRAIKDLRKAGLNPILAYNNSAPVASSSAAQSAQASGSSASGSSASGFKADYASGKRADLSTLDNLFPILAVSAISSAVDAFNSPSSKKPDVIEKAFSNIKKGVVKGYRSIANKFKSDHKGTSSRI